MRSDAFRQAAESKDFSHLDDLVVPDVTFHSPAVFKPYEGVDALRVILTSVMQVFTDFSYLAQVETGDTAVLKFRATVGERQVQGVDLLTFGDDGRLTDLTVMIRPLSGLHAVAEAMGAKLAEATAG